MTGLSYLPKYLCRLLPTAVRFRIGSVRNGPCTDIPVSSDTNPQQKYSSSALVYLGQRRCYFYSPLSYQSATAEIQHFFADMAIRTTNQQTALSPH